MNKRKTIAVVGILAMLLFLALGYIAFGEYSKYKQDKNLGIFGEGAQYGYEQAIIQVVQQVATCQQVPLRIENQTINVIAVDCLQ